MQKTYFVELDSPPDQTLLEALHKVGARLESALTGWSLPTTTSWEQLEAELVNRGIRFDLFVDMLPVQGDHDIDLAAYIPLVALDMTATPAVNDLILCRDETKGVTMASPALAEALSEVTSSLKWTSTEEHPRLVALSQVPCLPDPVSVPHSLSKTLADDGSWAIRSNGREVLTLASLDVIRTSGLAVTTQCHVDGETLPWRRPVIAGGRVIRFLQECSVRLNGQPVYLDIES